MTTLPHIVKRKSIYNSHHWRWFWDVKNNTEILEKPLKDIHEKMEQELNTIKYRNNKYEKYRK